MSRNSIRLRGAMRKALAASLAIVALLMGCKGDARSQAEKAVAEAAAEGRAVDCVSEDRDAYTPVCWYERSYEDGVNFLIIHRPDGSFRRLQVVDDGRGLVAADGAEEPEIHVSGDKYISLHLGDYKYLLPATIRSGDEAAE